MTNINIIIVRDQIKSHNLKEGFNNKKNANKLQRNMFIYEIVRESSI